MDDVVDDTVDDAVVDAVDGVGDSGENSAESGGRHGWTGSGSLLSTMAAVGDESDGNGEEGIFITSMNVRTL